MGFGRFIKKQFIDVIQWANPEEDCLMWRFPMEGEEIQNGASLTVRDSQMALFVDEGKAADAFIPGMYKLNTSTLPILTYLKNWDKLFESPFKSDVYFFNTKVQLGKKWGTPQPITIRDKEFGLVTVRAFGMYSYKITDPNRFFTEISGVCAEYRGDELEGQLRNLVVTSLSSLFGNSEIPFIDMAANQVMLSQKMAEIIAPTFERYGLALDNFAVESVNLPENLQKTLEERISMGIIGDMGRYTQYQTASSIPLAAQNEGGIAGIGAGMAAGMGMGQMMSGAMSSAISGTTNESTQPQASNNPPQASSEESMEVKLTKLKKMLDAGLITQEDYDTTKTALLKKILG